MSCNEDLAKESHKIQNIVKQVNTLSLELQKCLFGNAQKKYDYQNLNRTREHILKIIKGMTNRDLDNHTYHISQMLNVLAPYLNDLRIELDKRAKFGLIPIDGSDWEAPKSGRPSIGPRID